MFKFKGELYEGAHEAIVPHALFQQVQTILHRRGALKSKHKQVFPFRGLIECAVCGASITAETQKGHHYYRCTKKKGPCEQSRYIREEDLHAQLSASAELVSLTAVDADSMLLETEKWRATDAQASRARTETLRSELDATKSKLDRLLRAFLDGLLDRDEYAAQKERLLSDKVAIEARIEEVGAEGNDWLEPLQAFIREAEAAGTQEFVEAPANLVQFHRKIGSNVLLSGPLCMKPEGSEEDECSTRVDPMRGGRDSLDGGSAASARANQKIESRRSRSDRRSQSPLRQSVRGPARLTGRPVGGFFPMLPLLRQSPSDSTTGRRSVRSSTGQRTSGLVALRGPDKIPVLHVQYPNPWRILAERPKGILWHPQHFAVRTPSWSG